jgi:hypothetical protein
MIFFAKHLAFQTYHALSLKRRLKVMNGSARKLHQTPLANISLPTEMCGGCYSKNTCKNKEHVRLITMKICL